MPGTDPGGRIGGVVSHSAVVDVWTLPRATAHGPIVGTGLIDLLDQLGGAE